MELGKLSLTQFMKLTGIAQYSKAKKYFDKAYEMEVENNPDYENYEYGRNKKVPISRLAEVYSVVSKKEITEKANELFNKKDSH